ncbi:hypothetical protein [Wolbachia endosymbiont (group E) of Neria commutata]|uniref:hypothetical protein n=1 Tax=Wolbachia endosymbiont (group E) of Neria commutata TaxID=3066149 RepID=UPI0031329DBB
MSTYVDNLGRCRGKNIALTFLIIPAGLSSIASLVTISMPYWSPAPIAFFAPPAPLVAFAATPLGMGILAGFAALFALMAVLAISHVIANNKISEMEGPKIVLCNERSLILEVQKTNGDYEYITTKYQRKNDDDKLIPNEFCMGFTNSEGERVRIVFTNNKPILSGNYVGLLIASVEVKGSNDNYVLKEDLEDQLSALGLGTGDNDKKELITPFIKPTVATPKLQKIGGQDKPARSH